MNKKDVIERMYLDWYNNFCTIERFAEYYNLSIEQAKQIINIGSKMFQWFLQKANLLKDMG